MMKNNIPDLSGAPSPSFVIDEALMRRNLEVIADISARSGAEFILALKAFASWCMFPVIREYISGATASSLAEAMLVREKFSEHVHTYAPVYSDGEIERILDCSSHITFNSLSQFHRFGQRALLRGVSCGLRVNPGYSPVKTELYNPCCPGSRLGVQGLESLPAGIEGLHFHALCESDSTELVKVLESFEERFGHLLPGLKWLNMGGGHLVTADWYDRELLVDTIRNFREKYPNLKIILEPGSAFAWRTGWLVTSIEDIVAGGGFDTLMMNASFACHMPDCLEMPYKPVISGGHDPSQGECRYRVGGNSCLAGDYIGDWAFDRQPQIGDRLVFEDMIHYTIVKTTMFNGVSHPAIAVRRADGGIEVVRRFGYEDYRDRMS